MHPSALWWGNEFLRNYSIKGKVLVGSCQQIHEVNTANAGHTVYEDALMEYTT